MNPKGKHIFYAKYNKVKNRNGKNRGNVLGGPYFMRLDIEDVDQLGVTLDPHPDKQQLLFEK